MLKYILQRGALALAVALVVSFATFMLLNYATDPASALAGEDATPEIVEQIRQTYGFDRPVFVRYFEWLGGVARGDFGESYYWNKDVASLVLERAPVTIALALSALMVTIVIAIPLGASSVPAVMRLTRTGLIEVMESDYIRTARSKGYRGFALLRRHAMRNALLPVVSVLAVQLGQKFGGSVITESVFAINGLGRLALQSILGSDIPTVQMLIFIFALIFVLMNLLADLLNAALDPRIRIS